MSKSSFPTQSKKTVNNNDANVIVLRRVESDIEDTEIVDISNPPEDDVDSKDCVSDQDMMAVVKDELSTYHCRMLIIFLLLSSVLHGGLSVKCVLQC